MVTNFEACSPIFFLCYFYLTVVSWIIKKNNFRSFFVIFTSFYCLVSRCNDLARELLVLLGIQLF